MNDDNISKTLVQEEDVAPTLGEGKLNAPSSIPHGAPTTRVASNFHPCSLSHLFKKRVSKGNPLK